MLCSGKYFEILIRDLASPVEELRSNRVTQLVIVSMHQERSGKVCQLIDVVIQTLNKSLKQYDLEDEGEYHHHHLVHSEDEGDNGGVDSGCRWSRWGTRQCLCAHHPEHEVEGAHHGGVWVTLPDDLHVVLFFGYFMFS